MMGLRGDLMEGLAVLKAITNETKLRLVALLMENQLCVCELEEITNIRQANISKNLLSLKSSGIVDVRRDAQRGFYFLTDSFLENTYFLEHLQELKMKEPQLIEDHKVFLHHEEHKDENVYVCRTFRSEAN